MTKRNKVGLEELAKVAEQELGIPVVVTLVEESPKAAENALSQSAQQDIETELAYYEDQLAKALANVDYLLKHRAAAHLAAKDIKNVHGMLSKAESVFAKGDKELQLLEHSLLGGVVVRDGVSIPKLPRVSPEISRIEMFRRQAGVSKTRLANIIARDYGFEDANEVFELINSEKENVNVK